MSIPKHTIASVIKDFARIFWIREFNAARRTGIYGEKKDDEVLRTALATSSDCWWKETGGQVTADTVDAIWKVNGKDVKIKDLIPEEMERRQSQWNMYKTIAEAEPNRASELLVFEQGFVDEKGKLKIPDTIGVTCNRRAKQFLLAMIQRNNIVPEKGQPKLTLDWTVPVRFGDWSDELTRITEQNRENWGKFRGNLASSPLDGLLSARDMLMLGATQARLRETFGDSLGVKYYHIIMLSKRFPSVKIVERLSLDAGLKEYIPLASVQYPILQDMAQRTTPEETEAYNKKKSGKDGFPKPVLSLGEVELYFSDVKKSATGDSVKMADKNVVGEMVKVYHDHPFISLAAKRIHGNNAADTAKLKEVAEATAEISRNIMLLNEQGDLPAIEKIAEHFAKLKKGKQRNEAEKAAFKALGLTFEEANGK